MAERILVVDDEPMIRELLSQILKKEGAEVVTCSNGKEALQAVKENGKFDCILTDVKMPEMNGIEFLKQSHKITPETPVIVISGAATVDIAVEALKKGAAALIEKPFQSEKVVKTLKEILSLKEKADRELISRPYLKRKWSIECPGTKPNVAAVVEVLTHGMVQMGLLAGSGEYQVRDALKHALDNAVDHGNGGNPKKRILVNATATDGEMQVSIQDEGDGFNPLEYIEEDNLNEEAWKRGKGLFKIYSVAEKVIFNAKGNKILLTFGKA